MKAVHSLKRTVTYGAMLMLGLATPSAIPMGSKPADRFVLPKPVQQLTHLSPETLLVNSLMEIRHNRLDAALDNINALLKINPNFRLANLIKGDLLMARAGPITELGNASAPQDQLNDLREEAKVRLERYLDAPPSTLIPKYLVQMRPDQKYAVVVDTSKSRLYLYENRDGEPHYVADYYISIGKKGAEKNQEGDQRTPIGVYHVTQSLPLDKVGDFYGSGVFPISYPNEWDKRLGRNGHGIWLHGTPSNTYSRPPKASNGCVVLTNPDIVELGKHLQIGLTPVIISDGIEWISAKEWNAQREALNQQLLNWEHDWESRDTSRYLSHYAQDFSSDGQNLIQWADQKQRVNSTKSWIKVNLSNVSIFRYPGKQDMAVVTFDQDYKSNNLNNRMSKRQYWTLENNRWKIVYEGSAS